MKFLNDTDHLDQHFLIDENVKSKFIENMNLNNEDYVVEIGPGNGTITKEIAPLIKHLTLIELDTRLQNNLNLLKGKYNNIDIIYKNVLETYIPKCNKIVTSLPYSITEPFIEKLLRCEFDEVIMITGNTFVSNVINNSKTKLSLLTNSFFDVEKVMEILPESFNPKPHTLSALVKLKRKNKDLLDNITLFIFREIFIHRSKKIGNTLIDAIIKYKGITQKESKSLVKEFNLSDKVLSSNIENLNNKEIEEIFDLISNL